MRGGEAVKIARHVHDSAGYMTTEDHENFAKNLLLALSANLSDTEDIPFIPRAAQSRNAARAITAILCHRLLRNSDYRPVQGKNTTYEWNGGVFNCRNIADRSYFWTNVRRATADKFHTQASTRPAAYLLSFSSPSETTLSVWSLPEPVLYESLTDLPLKAVEKGYSVEIHPERQRIEHCPASADLSFYFGELVLSKAELRVLEEARNADAAAKSGRRITDVELDIAAAGEFDPSGSVDARERVLSSIVRRRGQPAFRRRLLAAYEGQCAISGCRVEDVLEAAHIVPYRGPETNHPSNGLLLRADLHTLFDLRLISIDVATMKVVVDPTLATTCYGEFAGKPLRPPLNRRERPSRKALSKHRRDSGL